MILYIIRHGEPDYETDSLLPAGKHQAEQLSLRFARSGLDRIYSSPMGRARETAAPTAEKLGLPVSVLPWAYELGHETYTYFPDGEFKRLSAIEGTYWMAPERRNLLFPELCEDPAVRETHFPDRYREISEGIDALLLENGYRRTEEGFYLPLEANSRRIALFCHVAMQRVILSRLLNLPFQAFNYAFIANYTGVTAFSFPGKDPSHAFVPRMISYGDVGHMYFDELQGPIRSYATKEEF